MPLLPTLALATLFQRDLAKDPTLYLVGYSHLDTEWCWSYRHSIYNCIPKTLSENFALFEKYPDYVFNWTGAKRYQFMKEYYPTEYAKLKQYVKQGRWIATGSGWDECDANIPAPESIIRQVLYSNRFFRQEFGVESNNYLTPDVFGFPASLPSSLAHAGLKGFSTCKLSYYPDTNVPIPFNIGRWEGPDGRSIVAALNCQSYHTRVKEDLSSSKTILDRIADQKGKSGLQFDYTYYGLGDEGGSPEPESVRWVEESKRGKGPIKVIAKGADQMFNDLTSPQRAALPKYQGELLISKHSAGTATSGAAMKRWNHRNELLADAAERSAIAARNIAGQVYPQARMTDVWQRFLSGQMHDILPGTSIPQAYMFAWNDQIVALNESADVVESSVAAVAKQMDTRVKGTPIVLYTPVSSPRQSVVQIENPTGSNDISVYNADGKIVISQASPQSISFVADLPSLSFSRYEVRRNSGRPAMPSSSLKVSKSALESQRYRVKIDANGDVSSIFDKVNNKELLNAPARLAFLHQKPSRHPAWNMDWEDQKKPPIAYVDGPAKISVSEHGPARVSMRIEREARGSKFVTTIALDEKSDRIDFHQSIDWRTSEASLKAMFPLAVSNSKATYDCGIGTVQRGNNWEKLYEGPSQRWFDLTDTKGDYGVSVLSEAKYGSDKPDDNTLRLTLLYTPGVTDRFQHQGTSDWGHHEIRYAIVGHKKSWQNGNIPALAAQFVQPIMPFAVDAHAGKLGASFSLAKIDNPAVSIMAMKKAEDSDETIVRIQEQHGQTAKAVKLRFNQPILAIREVDGQEKPLTGNVALSQGTASIDIKPYAVRAFAIKFALPKVSADSKPLALPFNLDVASSGTSKNDGNFNGKGQSIPGDLLPKKLNSGGIEFKAGQNAIRCEGQTINVPSGQKLSFLAASAEGDRNTTFQIGTKPTTLKIQAWNGFVGQWDTRQWDGAFDDEKTFEWKHALLGIAPGYIKRAPIAWYADHIRMADGKDDAYRFCYLFRYSLDIPKGTKTVTLPKDSNIIVMAMTSSTTSTAKPLAPLYDVLQPKS